MADKRVKKLRKADKENEKATKEEYAVAKFLRFNCPSKEAKFVPLQNMVHCFYGNKAIDTLLDSKWAKNTQGEVTLTDRKSCVIFLERLMVKGLFHRATKVERSKKERGRRKKKEEENPEEEKEKEKKVKKDKKKGKEKEKESEEKTEESVSKKEEKKDDEKKKDDDKKKKEKKLRLDMADEQRFIDGDEVYVWIYDPVPATTFIIGLLMVLGAAMLCLFPLWPDWMRGGVYYVSLVGASFVGLILLMVIVRSILFGVLWFVTFGTLHFWLLPNLTEDVGFFDSFKPTYTYSVYRKKDSDKENDKQTENKNEKKSNKKNDKTESESENNDQEQGYEIVQKEDVEDEEGSEGEEENNDENTEDVSEEVEDEDVEPKKTK